MTTADLLRWVDEVSNWGRWDNELGAANFITERKRVKAAKLVKEGLTVGMGHPELTVPFDPLQPFLPATPSIAPLPTVPLDPDNGNPFFHWMNPNDAEQQSRGVRPVRRAEPADGVVTRGVLFDATLLRHLREPGASWLAPGTHVHKSDLEALERIEHVKVQSGDVILLYTGPWARRAALGPWPTSGTPTAAGVGVAGYDADAMEMVHDREVAFTCRCIRSPFA